MPALILREKIVRSQRRVNECIINKKVVCCFSDGFRCQRDLITLWIYHTMHVLNSQLCWMLVMCSAFSVEIKKSSFSLQTIKTNQSNRIERDGRAKKVVYLGISRCTFFCHIFHTFLWLSLAIDCAIKIRNELRIFNRSRRRWLKSYGYCSQCSHKQSYFSRFFPFPDFVSLRCQ